MAEIRLKFLKIQRSRAGTPSYVYFQRNGRQWRLPGTWPQNPPSPEFIAEYHRLLAATEAGTAADAPARRDGFARGTMGALIADYLATGEFKQLKPRTRASYERLCQRLQKEHGAKPVALIERRHVVKIRDAFADRPGEANNVLRMLKILLRFAVNDGLIKASPAAGIKELRIGEWRDWNDDELQAFKDCWPEGSMQRRAFMLALYTGMRLSDLIAVGRANRKDGWVHATTLKTGEEIWVPEHSELTAELARGVQGITHLLTTPTQGKPFDAVYFGAWFADAIKAAGLPDDCVLHGLRKTAARTLADLGATTEELKAILGHATDRMAAKYAKAANKKRRAKAGMAKWDAGQN